MDAILGLPDRIRVTPGGLAADRHHLEALGDRTERHVQVVAGDRFRRTAQDLGLTLEEGAAGFVFNADPSAVVQFFEIGSTSTARLL